MSYGVALVCKCCQYEPFHSSVTFNISEFLKKAFGPNGLHTINSMKASDSIDIIERAIVNLEEQYSNNSIVVKDRYESSARNTIDILKELFMEAHKFKDHIWRII